MIRWHLVAGLADLLKTKIQKKTIKPKLHSEFFFPLRAGLRFWDVLEF